VPLIGAALECGGVCRADGDVPEAVAGGVALPAGGAHAGDTGAGFADEKAGACPDGRSGRAGCGAVVQELALDQAEYPRGAVLAAYAVDCGEHVLRDSELYYRGSHGASCITAVSYSAGL
jgi:hypothetical protein